MSSLYEILNQPLKERELVMLRKLTFFEVLFSSLFVALPVMSQTLVAPGDGKFGVPRWLWSNIYSIDITVLPNQGAALAYMDASSWANSLKNDINAKYPSVSVINSSHQDAVVTAALLEDYAHSANADAMYYSAHGGARTLFCCLPNTVPSTRGSDQVTFSSDYAGQPYNIKFGGYSIYGLYSSYTKWVFLDVCEPLGNTNNGITQFNQTFDGIHAIIGFNSNDPGLQHLVCTSHFMWWCTNQQWRYTSDKEIEFADRWINQNLTLWDSWCVAVRDKVYNEFGYGIEPAIMAPTGTVLDKSTGQWVGWNGYNERYNSVYSDPTPAQGSPTFRFSSLSRISVVYGNPTY
jgi:hypothetical protein